MWVKASKIQVENMQNIEDAVKNIKGILWWQNIIFEEEGLKIW